MIELDEYEMDGIAKLLHIAKRFADRGRLDLLLQASGKDAILSVETYLELEYDLPCLIFEDVTVQRHPEDDWRMFSERTVYIMRDAFSPVLTSSAGNTRRSGGFSPLRIHSRPP